MSESSPKVKIVTLGCAKNDVDSEEIAGVLLNAGCAIEPSANKLDVIVINTCGFLEAAKQESIRAIRDAVIFSAGIIFTYVGLAFVGSLVFKLGIRDLATNPWINLGIFAVFIVMDTWRLGRRAHLDKIRESALPMDLLLARAEKMSQRTAGTAIFMTIRSDLAPGALLHSMKHYHVLHERVVLMNVAFAQDDQFYRPAVALAREHRGHGEQKFLVFLCDLRDL